MARVILPEGKALLVNQINQRSVVISNQEPITLEVTMALFVGDPSAPTRFGMDVANTSDETGLFLKLFGGEVFAAFSEAVHTADKHYMREISSGKSAQFPKTYSLLPGLYSCA
ncbi:MAG: hypothetical protein GEU78_07890 [Actinobacteria bacterium]|nr:hypothetical protein [Actinomycetota bacterium]